MYEENFSEMSFEEFRDYLTTIGEMYEELMAYLSEEEYIKAVLGITEIDSKPYLVYSAPKIVNVICERDGMSHEEALEFFEYNIKRSTEYTKGNILYVY